MSTLLRCRNCGKTFKRRSKVGPIPIYCSAHCRWMMRKLRPPSTNSVQVMLRMPSDLVARVRAAAAADDRTVSQWVRKLIVEHLERENTP